MLAGVVSGLAFLAMMTAVLFASAGRSDLPMFWCYLAVWLVFLPIGTLTMDPELIRERMHPGPGARDYGRTLAFIPLTLAQFVVAGIDVGRFHWSDTVPLAVQTAGLVMTAAALAITTWASAVNRFFSSVIRIQTERGHQVVTSGPYRVVRHPAYACTPFLFVGTGLALGSWLAALVGLLLLVAVLRRVVEEDRILLEELDGYAAYARKVRYRLIPGVW
jgi:protein-S-isoprenylcysteine O-methyltransferase Ste14